MGAVELSRFGYDAPPPQVGGPVVAYVFSPQEAREALSIASRVRRAAPVFWDPQMPGEITCGQVTDYVNLDTQEWGVCLIGPDCRWVEPPSGPRFVLLRFNNSEILLGAPGNDPDEMDRRLEEKRDQLKLPPHLAAERMAHEARKRAGHARDGDVDSDPDAEGFTGIRDDAVVDLTPDCGCTD